MTKANPQTDDEKKMAMKVKALEAQLRQTISKKEHHEIVLEFEDKMTDMEKKIAVQEKKIAEQDKELVRAKSDLQKSNVLNGRLAEVGDQVEVIYKAMGAQGKTVDSLASKLADGTVPSLVHQQAISTIRELEARYDEATRRLNKMVPASDYEALKQRAEELEGTISSMVPREQLESSEETIKELRATLADYVPQSSYDELVARVVQLAQDVTGGTLTAEEEVAEEATPETAAPAEPAPAAESDAPEQLPPAPEQVEPVVVVQAEFAPQPEVEAPEITEVGSAIAEIGTSQVTEKEVTEVAEEVPNAPDQPAAEEPTSAPEVLQATASTSPGSQDSNE